MKNIKLLKLPIINERFLISILKVLSSNYTSISKKFLTNIDYLFNVIDLKYYLKDSNVYSLILAIQIAIKQKENSNNKIDSDNLISEIIAVIPEIYSDQIKNIIIPTINIGKDLSNPTELKSINQIIDIYLKYSTILLTKDSVNNALTDITSGNVSNLQKSIDNYRNIIEKVSEEFRKTDSSINNDVINSTDEAFIDDILMTTYNQVKNPKSNLITGLKMFNEMLSEEGGFRTGCYYIFYALINSFKSGILQYCQKWIRKYNSDNYKKLFSETGKIPTILFYSFENTKSENMQREFYMETGVQLKDVETPEEAKRLWRESYNNTNSIINVTYVYKEANTVRISDMKRDIHTLEDSGYKVIALIVDYLELIRPEDEDLHLENRLRLGYISNSFHVMCVTEDIVGITAMQMNRAAESTIADLRNKGQTNIINQVGGMQFIGESFAIEKPADGSFYLGIERSIYDNELYLAIKRGKLRYKRTNLQYFVTKLKNGFYIEDDYGTNKINSQIAIMPTQSDENVEEITEKTKQNTKKSNKTIRENKVKDNDSKELPNIDDLISVYLNDNNDGKNDDDIDIKPEECRESSKYISILDNDIFNIDEEYKLKL